MACSLTSSMYALRLSSSATSTLPPRSLFNCTKQALVRPSRPFSTTRPRLSWLIPKRKLTFKDPTGRPRINTGGSVRGTTVIWGDYGLRMRDHDRRISAAQLKNGEAVIRQRLRNTQFRLYTRLGANTAVYKKGNEARMGTGKGSFDHWAARVPVNRVIFEIRGNVHEEVIRDAMRLAANKMPGLYEFIKKGDPPIMGMTKLKDGVTKESLLRPRRESLLPTTNKARSIDK